MPYGPTIKNIIRICGLTIDFLSVSLYDLIMTNKYDVIIIGAGASGLSAARTLIARGKRVAVLDMGHAPARKVMASGGGRCNFTNTASARDRYFGNNPDFVRGALARVSPTDMLAWGERQNLKFTQKSHGQYFCKTGAADVVAALTNAARSATIILNTPATDIEKRNDTFIIKTSDVQYHAKSVIIATGGISFPTLGVSDFGYKIAKKFGHKIVPVRPALCAIKTSAFSSDLAGISVMAEITIGRTRILDSLMFTHFGIGGPATYRATVRDIDDGIDINLMPETDALQILREGKKTQGRKSPAAILGNYLPMRLARWIAGDTNKNVADFRDADLATIAGRVNKIFIPRYDIKYHTLHSAEVVRGGISTDDVSSSTMESKLCSGLFFAGEVLDIAGDLGGFNLQWAWSSGIVAGMNA